MEGRNKERRTKTRASPFSIRLSFEERARLEDQAAGVPLGAYVKAKIFDGEDSPKRKSPGFRAADRDALCQVLAKLGSSRLANNLNQLARAANIGTLPVTPEIEQELADACAEIREMRLLLLKSLGAREPSP